MAQDRIEITLISKFITTYIIIEKEIQMKIAVSTTMKNLNN
jgi:hypothetical protein